MMLCVSVSNPCTLFAVADSDIYLPLPSPPLRLFPPFQIQIYLFIQKCGHTGTKRH